MAMIPRKYIVDENNTTIGVQLEISVFNKIEEILENHALAELMKQNFGEEKLGVAEARSLYKSLDKVE